ncbi:MAG: hypothetical protein Kow0069_11340 [Promethearchaeota archaeon]
MSTAGDTKKLTLTTITGLPVEILAQVNKFDGITFVLNGMGFQFNSDESQRFLDFLAGLKK